MVIISIFFYLFLDCLIKNRIDRQTHIQKQYLVYRNISSSSSTTAAAAALLLLFFLPFCFTLFLFCFDLLFSNDGKKKKNNKTKEVKKRNTSVFIYEASKHFWFLIYWLQNCFTSVVDLFISFILFIIHVDIVVVDWSNNGNVNYNNMHCM